MILGAQTLKAMWSIMTAELLPFLSGYLILDLGCRVQGVQDFGFGT